MISASHNPYQDNGIKIFSSTGLKLNDAVEEHLEREIVSNSRSCPPGFSDPDYFTRNLSLDRVPRTANCTHGVCGSAFLRISG